MNRQTCPGHLHVTDPMQVDRRMERTGVGSLGPQPEPSLTNHFTPVRELLRRSAAVAYFNPGLHEPPRSFEMVSNTVGSCPHQTLFQSHRAQRSFGAPADSSKPMQFADVLIMVRLPPR